MQKPTAIKLHKQSKTLEIHYGSQGYTLPAEYLRVHSPSAEVRGHGPGQETLQQGKRGVAVTRIEPVGHYAARLIFDDGHDSGLYTWKYLFELGSNQDSYWQTYLDRLQAAGYSREPANAG